MHCIASKKSDDEQRLEYTAEVLMLIFFRCILQNEGEGLINNVDRDDRTPLHYAAAKGSFQVKSHFDFSSRTHKSL